MGGRGTGSPFMCAGSQPAHPKPAILSLEVLKHWMKRAFAAAWALAAFCSPDGRPRHRVPNPRSRRRPGRLTRSSGPRMAPRRLQCILPRDHFVVWSGCDRPHPTSTLLERYLCVRSLLLSLIAPAITHFRIPRCSTNIHLQSAFGASAAMNLLHLQSLIKLGAPSRECVGCCCCR